MEAYIFAALLVILLVIWGICTQRRLLRMDGDIKNAMRQIGALLSARFDALTALLELAGRYDARQAQALLHAVKSRRAAITEKSTPADVLKQGSVVSESLRRIDAAAAQYPALKAESDYRRCMDEADNCGRHLRAERLLYNDSVAKFNRAIRIPPASLIAGRLGFHARDYLETSEDTAGYMHQP